jgi:ELWxxDGT repeat protein
MPSTFRARSLLMAALGSCLPSAGAAQAYLVRDIANAPVESSSPREFVSTGRVAYFTASGKLWRSDGTPEGTWRCDGPTLGEAPSIASDCTYVGYPYSTVPWGDTAVLGDLAVFGATDGMHGRELWVTDGSPAGARMVRDVVPGPQDGCLDGFAVVDGVAYFAIGADWRVGRRAELWRTDGTTAGTWRVAELEGAKPTRLTAAAGAVFFVGQDASHGYELWRSDGTAAGTALLVDTLTGPTSGMEETQLESTGDLLFFTAGQEDTQGHRWVDLWRTDGTPAGTVRLAYTPRTPTTSFQVGAGGLEAVGQVVFFAMNLPAPDGGLWKSDGTPAGTVRVSATTGGALAPFGGLYTFARWNSLDQAELWASDGTDAGTRRIAILGTVDESLEATTSAGLLYITASSRGPIYDGNHLVTTRRILWRSDGTEAGTYALVNSCCLPFIQHGPALAPVPDGVVFAGHNPYGGVELWRSDGTRPGTLVLREINTVTGDSSPTNLTDLRGRLHVTVADATNGADLWRSDGTFAGTTKVLDVDDPWTDFGPSSALARLGDWLLLGRRRSGPRYELARTDGTAAGTSLVANVRAWDLTTIGDRTFFASLVDGGRYQPWVTDGTAPGTYALSSGSSYTENYRFTAAAGMTFFVASGGNELWRTDGTPEGTQRVTDRFPGPIGNLAGLSGRLAFTLDETLWSTAGAPETTVDITPPELAGASWLGSLAAAPSLDRAFFSATVGGVGAGAWVTDGTPAGTLLLTPVAPGGVQGTASGVVPANGRAFFWMSRAGGPREVWATDGTPAGTVQVAALPPGPDRTWYPAFTAVGGHLLFLVDTPEATELWRSDGTPMGTRPIADAWAPGALVGPSQAAVSGSRLFLTLDDRGTIGTELWAIDLDPDGDGVLDPVDSCRLVPNPDQADADGDGTGDACDACAPGIDADGDNQCDSEDNCRDVSNPGQDDLDSDGIGDICDPDRDGDGVSAADGDCDDTDGGAIRRPDEVTGVRVTRTPAGIAVTWDPQPPDVGSGVQVRVLLGPLCPGCGPRVSWPRDWAWTWCFEAGTTELATALAAETSLWLLVSARFGPTSPCPRGSVGDSSVTPDPRDQLDSTYICP